MKMKFIVFKKLTAVILTALMLISFVPFFASAAGTDYTIVNPYANVNWSTTGQYKANLHTHSTVSDGSEDFSAMVERHYALGYDILAMTDHGTVDKSWTNLNIHPLLTFAMNIDTLGSNSKPLTLQRFEEITAGVGRDGRGMLRVPDGIEQNAASFNNTHVNSFFCDYGDGYLGGTSYYDQVLKGVQDAGGLSFINHIGMYTGAQNDTAAAAYDTNNLHYNYMIKKFTKLFENYHTCVGMEIINADDNRTQNDRKLWDILLENVIPTGRSIFGFGNSDAHSLSAIDTSWEIMCMPANTVENLRTCMEQGAFFAGTRDIKNPLELAQLEKETGLTLGTAWTAPSGTVQPKVTDIAVNQQTDQIKITAQDCKTIHWIANGRVICVGSTLNLDSYSSSIGSYVRAEIWGPGGILYTQPFVLHYAGEPVPQSFFFFDFGSILNYFERAFYSFVASSKVLTYVQHLALGD